MNFKLLILYISFYCSLFIGQCSLLTAQDTVPVTIIHLDSTINSIYCEFSPFKIKDSVLFFSSIRPDADEGIESFIKRNFICKIYSSAKSGNTWNHPKIFIPYVNLNGTNNANINFTGNHKKFYFSRESGEDVLNKITSIYVCEFKKGKWQKPEKLGGTVNLKDYSSTQPAVSELPDGTEILYFSSDRPGGIGKKDIWYSTLIAGKYTDPINLGPNVNSTGDEITPFYHQASGTLYYSSEGLNGRGGFDIYKSKGFKNTWNKSVHFGEPFNTKYDEINFTVNESDTNGYFASNRPGSFFLSEQVSCYDIYEYQWIKKPKPPEKIVKKDTIFEPDSTKLSLLKDTSIIKEHPKYSLQPITLYFDNDQPEPRTLKVKTDINYYKLLENYISERDKFIKSFIYDLSGAARDAAEKDITAFFDNKVVKAKADLDKFSEQLLELLKKNCDVTLEISGFCSPLHSSLYNLNLSKRRISSFVVYLNQFQNGVFAKYIRQTSAKTGKLSIVEIPEGKTKAPPDVSDNPKDKRNSIYSPAASLERRIHIQAKVKSL